MEKESYLRSKLLKHGDKFDSSKLAPQFWPFFRTGTRIRVNFGYRLADGSWEELTGTVGITTGWRPTFLLMRRCTDRGSPWVLGVKDRIVAVKEGRKYIPV